MRIMQIDVNFDESSTGKIVRDLRNGLRSLGHEVVAAYGRGELPAEPGVIRVANPVEVFFHAGMTRLTGRTGGFSPIATRKLQSAIEEFEPDVVHLHELHGYYVNLDETLRFLHDRQIPIVWTFHCEFMYTGKCGQALDCERWKTGCGNCPQLDVYPRSLFFDFTRQMFAAKRSRLEMLSRLRLVTPSNWLAGRIGESFLRDRRVDVIHNGIDTDDIFFPRDQITARDLLGIASKYVIVSVAPDIMTPQKGGHWVLELARRMKEVDVTFVMVGVNDSAPAVGFPNVIAIPRTRDQDFLANAYSAADVFLLTSEKETASTVTSESLVCGTPVVGFDCGGPREIAPDGYGRWVKYGDIDELHRVLGAVLDGSLPMRTREDCRVFGVEHYSKQRMVERYLDIYREIAE